MSKPKEKKRKKPQTHQQGGYKKYLKDLTAAMRKLDFNDPLKDFSAKNKRFIYDSHLTIANPELRRLNSGSEGFMKSFIIPRKPMGIICNGTAFISEVA